MASKKPLEILLALVIWTVWIAAFFYLSPKHVSWRDEYQSWLVSTRTETPAEFFEGVRYERHPPLHYILQRGFHAQFPEVAPETSIKMVTGVFSGLTVGLILLFFPAALWLRVILVFGMGFVLEYGLISRVYALGIFFLFASALAARKRRKLIEVLLLILTAFTHLYFTCIVGAILLYRLWPIRSLRDLKLRLKQNPLLILLGLALLIAVLIQRPPPDTVFTTRLDFAKLNPLKMLYYLGWGLTGIDNLWGSFEWNNSPHWTAGLGLIFTWLLWHQRHRFNSPAKELLAVLGACLLLMNLGYPPAARHVMILWIVVLYFALRENWRPPLLRILALFMCFATLRFMLSWAPWQEIPNFDFSGQRELKSAMSAELQDPQSILVVDNEDIYFPVMGALDINVYAAKRDRLFKYTYFKGSEWITDLEKWCASPSRAKLQGEYKKVYLGLDLGKTPPASCGSNQLVFQTQRPVVFDEKYQIYILN